MVKQFLIPLLQAINPEYPFLGDKERHAYLTQAIQLAVHQILTFYSFPKGTKEMVSQILMAQSTLKNAIQRGMIPKRLKMKKYFKEAVLLYGIVAHARGEKAPPLLYIAFPSDLLPWWPKGFKRRRRRFGKRFLLPH